MAEDLSALLARMRAAVPGLADVPDAALAQALAADAGPSVADALSAPTFRTSNEKDPSGAAVVRETPSAWTKAATIGAPGLGDRYPLASVGEMLASDNPLKLLAEYITGPGRPRSVQAADPIGIDAFTQGVGPMPLLMGTTEDVAGIRGYHGSPHDFAQFDASKIGTGEGAQAYGHGLYFAQKEGTATGYRDRLSQIPMHVSTPESVMLSAVQTAGDVTPAADLVEAQIAAVKQLPALRAEVRRYIDSPAFTRPEYDRLSAPLHAAEDLVHQIPGVAPGVAEETVQTVLPALEEAAARLRRGELPPKGHMYEVRIKADPAHFLDWDAPLSAQHPQVQQAVQQMRDAGVLGDETGAATTGAQLIQSKSVLAPEHNLQRAGVPGIKYLDAGSRAAGEGSRNYVVFPGNESLIDILRKYGLLAPLAGASVGEALRSAPDPRHD